MVKPIEVIDILSKVKLFFINAKRAETLAFVEAKQWFVFCGSCRSSVYLISSFDLDVCMADCCYGDAHWLVLVF